MGLSANFALSALALTISVFVPQGNAETIINQTYTGSFPAVITGTLPNQDSVLEESFTVTTTGDLTALTTSYATGGFQPNITLYNSSGIAIANQWATPPAGAKADPATGLTLDSYLSATSLAAGTYTLTLTDWALNQSATATNLSDGFKSNFGNGVTFVDVQGNTRTGAYALNLNLSTTTPEPATVLLLAPVMFVGWLFRKHLVSVR
jgi:hypothetical protein